ncbi:MAG: hypothetical protein ACQER7_15195, partial [Bacteroidota bacterium]
MRKSKTNLKVMITVFLIHATLSSGIVYAQSQKEKNIHSTGDVPVETVERLRAIYEGNEFNPKSFQAKWNPDGSGYMRLESLSGEDKQGLVSYDVVSGDSSV